MSFFDLFKSSPSRTAVNPARDSLYVVDQLGELLGSVYLGTPEDLEAFQSAISGLPDYVQVDLLTELYNFRSAMAFLLMREFGIKEPMAKERLFQIYSNVERRIARELANPLGLSSLSMVNNPRTTTSYIETLYRTNLLQENVSYDRTLDREDLLVNKFLFFAGIDEDEREQAFGKICDFIPRHAFGMYHGGKAFIESETGLNFQGR